MKNAETADTTGIISEADSPKTRAGIAAIYAGTNCIENSDSACGSSGVESRPVYGSLFRGRPSIKACI